MINDIHSKFDQFCNYVTQTDAGEKDKLELLANELLDEISKSQELNVDQDLTLLANSVAKVMHSRDSERIKIMRQAERIFKACEQKVSLKHQFSPELGKSIKTLETQLNRENLLNNIDDKKLGFIHGDSFISSSGLEGGESIENIQFLLPYLKESGLFSQKEEMISLLEECVAREESRKPNFSLAKDKDSLILAQRESNQYAELLCDKIKNLKNGERFLMTGGWRDLGGGHALLYLIEKEKNGNYAFTVVNTGEGIDNHQAQEIDLKTKHKPILRLCDIDESLMANKNFFVALHECEMRIHPKDGKTAWLHSASDIYDRILPALQGKRDLKFEDQVDFITDQRSGTCSWMSLTKLLHTETSDTKKYKSFNFALRRDSLSVYFNKLCQGNLPLEGMRLELLKRCTENFARNSLKQHKRGIISNAELERAQKLVEDIQKQIKFWLSSVPAKKMEIQLDQTTPLQGTILDKELFIEHEVNSSIVSQSDLSSSVLSDHVLEKMPETLDQFQTKLDNLIATCKNLSAKEEYRLSNEAIGQFLISINSFEKSIDLWTEGIEHEKIEKTMGSVLTVFRSMLSNIAALPMEERGSPEQFALMTILAVLNSKLGSKIDDKFVLHLGMYERGKEEEFYKSPYFIIYNHKLQTVFNEADSYLKKLKGKINLFDNLDKDTKEKTVSLKFNMLTDENPLLQKLLNSPSFLEKIAQKNPENLRKSDKEKLILAFQSWGTEDCPFSKHYQILNEMGVLINYFTHNPRLQMLNPGKAEELGKLAISVTEVTDQKIKLSPTFSGRRSDLKDRNCYLDRLILEKQTLFSEIGDRIKHPGIKELMEMNWDDFSTDSHLPSLINWNKKSNQAVTLKAKPGLSRRMTQELAYILSNEVTKTPNLIAYFQEHPELLSETDYQFLLIYQLFSKKTLNELMNNQLLLDKLFSFIEAQFALQKSLGNIQQQLFFLSFADLVRDYAKENNPQTGIKLALDIQQEFARIISNIVVDTLDGKRLKALAYQQYIASFNKNGPFTEENCLEIYKGYAYVMAFGYDKNLTLPHTKEKMVQTLRAVNQKIDTLGESFHKTLLQQVSHEILGVNHSQWEGTYPHFYDSNSSYKINFNPLTIFDQNTIIGSLPQEFIQNPSFQKILGNSPFIATMQKPGLFELKSTAKEKIPEKFRLYLSKKDHTLKILKQINNEWYTYIPNEELDGILRPASLVQSHTHWMRKTKDEEAELLIESEEGKKIESVVELTHRGQGSFQVSRWRNLISQTTLQDLYRKPSQLSSHLNDFQPIDSVFLWKDDKIEFSSVGIDFKINNQQQLIYSKNSEFRLTTLQEPPNQLPHFTGYLEMEGKNHEKRYLIPKGTVRFLQSDFKKSPEGVFSAGQPDFKYEPGKGPLSKAFKIQCDVGDKAGYYEFTEKNGKLIGKNPEENLYLASLLLAQKNYEEANELLKQNLVGRPKKYSEREAELIERLVNWNNNSNDFSPEALALSVKALYLRMRNAHEIDKKSLSILARFYPMAHHAKQLFLSPDEERELLEHIEKKFQIPPIMNQFLNQANIPLAQTESNIPPVLTERLKQLKGEAIEGEKNVSLKSQVGTFIPPTVSHREIDFSQLLEFKKSEEPLKEIFFGEGENYFDNQFQSLLKDIASHDATVRKATISKLLLLDLTKGGKRSTLRDLMVLFSLNSDRELRSRLNARPTLENFIYLAEYHRFSTFFSFDEKEKIQTKTSSKFFQKIGKERNIPQLELDHAVQVPVIQTILSANQIALRENPAEIDNVKTAELVKMLAIPKGKSKIEAAEYFRVQQSVEADAKAQESQKFYQYEESQIKKLHDAFEQEVSNYAAKIESQKNEILKLANKLPADPNEALKRQLKLAGKKKKELTIDDLIIFFLQNNGKGLIKQNPYLSEEDTKRLVNLLTSYLIDSTEAEHLKQLSQKTGEVLNEKDMKRDKALLDLNTMLRAVRSYQPENETFLLIFEYYTGFRLRESQVNTIRSMILTKDKECTRLVNQLIMGSGKTKAILPLLALLNSRGDNIPFILAPDQLYETNLEDMRALSGELLNQEIETIEIKKEKALTIEDMEEILHKFKRVKKRRSYCLINQSTASTLYLHYKEIVTNLPNEPKKYDLMKQIMNVLANEGDLIIDEADMVLDCLKEMNFSRGGWKNVNQIIQSSLFNTFSELVKDPVLNEFFKIEKESEVPFDEQKYEKTIKPHLAQMFIKLAGLPESKSLDDYLTLVNYVLSAKEVKEVPKAVLDADDAAKCQLALGKELIKSLFPLVMNKNCNEHFGLSHILKSFKAIPYMRSSTPSEGSEFGTPLETLIYTMLYFTREGVDEKQLKTLIDECKASALAEYKSEGTPLKQTKGYQNFAQLNLVEGKDLFSLQDSELKKAAEAFNQSIENKMRFAKLYGWSEVGIYPERLSCNPQNLVGMFRSVQGFTGTLWNAGTFHKSLKPAPDMAVDGKTLNILHLSNPKVTAFPMDLKKFYSALAGYDACIDVGAWFRGISCLEVATNMLENLPPSMKGIVYLNDVDIPIGTKGQTVILERGKKIPQLLSQTNLLESERFTYYNVTTGADIPQHALAKALVTISKTLTLRDLLQGVWRMRGLDKKQKCDFAIPEELGDPTLAHILAIAISNQARRQMEDNLRALQQQMKQLVEHTIDRVLLSPKVNASTASEIVKDAKHFFIHETEEDLFKLFGGIESKIPIKDIIEPLLKKTIESVNDLYYRHAQFEETIPLETLKSDLQNLIDYNLLPEEEYQKADYNLQTQVRNEIKLEQQSKTETKTNLETIDDQVDLDKDVENPVVWPSDKLVNLYSSDFDFFGREKVDDYLYRHRKQLNDKRSPHLFTSDFFLSKNFMGFSNYAYRKDLESKFVPFQSGNKFGGVSALQVARDGSLQLTFLHPNESEYLSTILKMERKIDYEKLNAFPPQKYIALIADETRAFFREERASGRLKEKLKSILIDFDKEWVEQIISREKIDQAWLKDFLKEFPDHVDKNQSKDKSKFEKEISRTKEDVENLVEILDKIDNDLMNFLSTSFKKNSSEAFSLTYFYNEICEKYFPFHIVKQLNLMNSFNNYLEKRLYQNFGFDKLMEYRRLPASQLYQLFTSKKMNDILLVHPILGMVESGNTDVEKLQLEKNPEYTKLMTQAKFFMGIIDGYKPEEKAYLTYWIKEKGAEEMENFLLKSILSVREGERRKYPNSALKKIIDACRPNYKFD